MNDPGKQTVKVSLRNISMTFGTGTTRVDAIQDITMDVMAGEVVGLRGPSGSGKSTLLNIIGCVLEPSKGLMWLDGEAIYDNRWLRADLRKLRLDKIGFIFQFHNLIPFLTSLENVSLVLDLAGVPASKARDRARELLRYLGVDHRENSMPANLSGGEAQRVTGTQEEAALTNTSSTAKQAMAIIIHKPPTKFWRCSAFPMGINRLSRFSKGGQIATLLFIGWN